MNSKRALFLIVLFCVQMLLTSCRTESKAVNGSIVTEDQTGDQTGDQTSSSSYSGYETLIDPATSMQISVGMSKSDLERILGGPTKSEESGNEGDVWNSYDDGITINFHNNIAMSVSVNKASSGYITQIGNISIGDAIDEVRKQFGDESIFLKGYNDLVYALTVRGDEAASMKLPMESAEDARELLKDSEMYFLEFRIGDHNKVSKISLIAKEMYLPKELHEVNP